jgi:deazaflavin-dependent oxidoreductase (nitroreductase family)
MQRAWPTPTCVGIVPGLSVSGLDLMTTLHTPRMTPPRPVLRVFWALHRALRRISGGRIGTSEATGDRKGTLFLHTVGRKSGKPRANGLFYLVDGSNLIVVASNAGADADPAWWLNLLNQPEAEVEVAGRRSPVRGRIATTEEDARLWPRLVAANPGYATYREKVSRLIPVVILEPR